MRRKQLLLYFAAAGILLFAGALRLYHIADGYGQSCLLPQQEAWRNDTFQLASLYSWNVLPLQPTTRYAIGQTPQDLFFLRLWSAALGLIAVSLMIQFTRRLKSNWWILAGLCVAGAPWFVEAERWLVRYGPAVVAVGVACVALVASKRSHVEPGKTIAAWIRIAASLSLFVLAPPLWWLAIVLLLLKPAPRWRPLLFVGLVGLVSIPAIQSPYAWLASTQSWDSGATAACVWALLALIVWQRPTIPAALQAGLAVVVFVANIALGVATASQQIRPNDNQWKLIDYLQSRLPDNSIVQFDRATWPLTTVVMCPQGANIPFRAQPQPTEFTFLQSEPYEYAPPDFVVAADPKSVEKAAFVQNIADQYYVGRMAKLPNSTDIRFGDLFYVVGYQLLTPEASPGSLVEVRVDYQFSSSVTVDALRYVAFIHLTPIDDVGNKIVNLNIPFVEESGHFGPRRFALNQHYRFMLPGNISPGTYQIILGIYNVYTGERLSAGSDSFIKLGEVKVK